MRYAVVKADGCSITILQNVKKLEPLTQLFVFKEKKAVASLVGGVVASDVQPSASAQNTSAPKAKAKGKGRSAPPKKKPRV